MGAMQFRDIGEISTREETPEGFLTVVADFARAGIQEYYAGELPRNQLPQEFQNNPMAKIRLLRPAEEVFDPKAMRSFASKPVTNEHPKAFVDKRNFRQVVVGMAKHKVERNEDKLRVGLVLQDESVINEVNQGKDQLSAGYSSKVIWGEGTDPAYGVYDGKQTQIRGNHIAVVSQARGGPEIRINDSWPSATKPKEGKRMAERNINGIAVEFSDQGAQAVDQLMAEKQKLSGKVAALEAKLTDAAKETERIQGELDAQKAAELTDDQIETKVAERLAVVDSARRLHPDVQSKDAEGKCKTLDTIKREAIAHADSSFNLEGKSAEYVDGVFETLVGKAPDRSKSSLKEATQHADHGHKKTDIAGDARRKFNERNANAWKFEEGGQA